MKNSIIVILFLLCGRSFGQQETQLPISPATIQKTKTTHSPDIASLGKYVLSAPAYSSGAAQKNIPLFTLEENGLSYPIDLNYSFSGFKKRERANTAGLGWSLPEYSIIRNVKGLPDGTAWQNFDDFNYTSPLTSELVQLSPNPILGFYSTYNLTANRIYNKKIDNQPDEYIYNIGGYSGKFYWLDGVAVKFPHNDLEITCPNYTPGSIYNSFKITTPDGIDFILEPYDQTYGQRHWDYRSEAYEWAYYAPECGGTTAASVYEDGAYTTAWRVTKMENRNTKARITFEYNGYDEQVYSDGAQTNAISFYTNNAAELAFNPYYSSMTPLDDPHPSYLYKKNYNLKKIKSAHYVIDYKYTGANASLALDSIIISADTISPQVVKRIKFNHSAYALNELGIYGQGEEKKYKFTYYTSGTGGVPDITSKSIDHWGYYNGSQNAILVPKTDMITQMEASGTFNNVAAYPYINWANREPDFLSAKQNGLIEIIYPTGGKSTIEYESANGKGVRVRSVKDIDYFGAPEISRYYTYAPNTAPPIPGYNSNQYQTDQLEGCYNANPNDPPAWTSDLYLTVTASAMSSLSDFQLSQNYYNQVVEYLGSPTGINGRNEYKFTMDVGASEQVLPTEQSSYNATGVLVKKTVHQYDIQVLKTIHFFTDPILLNPPLLRGCTSNNGTQYCDPPDPIFPFSLSKDNNLAIQPGSIKSTWIKHLQTTETLYGSNNAAPITDITSYTYLGVTAPDLPKYTMPFNTTKQLSNGGNMQIRTYYPGDVYNDGTNSVTLGPVQMWTASNLNYKRLLSLPVKMVKSLNGVQKELLDYTYTYNTTNDEVNLTKSVSQINTEPVRTINLLYNKGNLLKQTEENQVKDAFIRDYNQQFVTAKISNADASEAAYTGFEGTYAASTVADVNKGNWDFDKTLIGNNSVTGTKGIALPVGNYSVTSGFVLASGKKYALSFWSVSTGNVPRIKLGTTVITTPAAVKTLNGGAKLYKLIVTGNGQKISLSNPGPTGSCYIDEVRLQPETAQMQTFSFDRSGNIITACDGRDVITFYSYDALGRLEYVKNEWDDILKKNEYKLQQ